MFGMKMYLQLRSALHIQANANGNCLMSVLVQVAKWTGKRVSQIDVDLLMANIRIAR
jgi:hypothetical protein